MDRSARLLDFDAAYSNVAAVPAADRYPPLWQSRAQAFRSRMVARGRAELGEHYGPHERHVFDLFHPEGEAAGLTVFLHGGYWKAFCKDDWSHLARGALDFGHAVAIPSYRLCPAARIFEIGEDIGAFLAVAAGRVEGPIHLAGHSAGGQLASRIAARGAPLAPQVQERIARIVSISGLHDLRPLLRTSMNAVLRIDDAEALAESPIFLEPAIDAAIIAYVGGDELPEFRRQAELLSSVWGGLGARTLTVEAAGRHHFDVIDEMGDGASRLVRLLTGTSPV